jgi:hypothetical protein
MARKRKPKQEQPPSRFSVGDKVRVRPGMTDPDWPDVPLGGWAGSVEEVNAAGAPVTYLLKWSKETLRRMPRVARQRSEREGLDVERMWLNEEELQPDDGSPLVIEKPGKLAPRPLQLDDEEDRVRAALGLMSRDDPVPSPNPRSLEKYSQYLTGRLSFPFAGRMMGGWENGPAAGEEVLVLRLLPTLPGDYGLTCEVRRDSHSDRKMTPDERNQAFAVPLTIVEVPEGPNAVFLRDYAFWQGEG